MSAGRRHECPAVRSGPGLRVSRALPAPPGDPARATLTGLSDLELCYEFLRVSTHRRVFRTPWTAADAWRFMDALPASPGMSVPQPTERHAAVLAQTLNELADLRGNLMHHLHTAMLMREHGVNRICTRDTDFHRFTFLTVVDPLR